MRWIFVALPVALFGCGEPSPHDPPPIQQLPTAEIPIQKSRARAEPDPEVVRERQIEATRQSDRAINWVNIGISTGKFSERLRSSVHQTYEECIKRSFMEDNECFPIPALPDSYWNAKPAASGIAARSDETAKTGSAGTARARPDAQPLPEENH